MSLYDSLCRRAADSVTRWRTREHSTGDRRVVCDALPRDVRADIGHLMFAERLDVHLFNLTWYLRDGLGVDVAEHEVRRFARGPVEVRVVYRRNGAFTINTRLRSRVRITQQQRRETVFVVPFPEKGRHNDQWYVLYTHVRVSNSLQGGVSEVVLSLFEDPARMRTVDAVIDRVQLRRKWTHEYDHHPLVEHSRQFTV